MKIVNRLFLSGSVFVLAKVSVACSAETSTASNVLSNLLTTTAGAIAQNQPAQQGLSQNTTAVPQVAQSASGSQSSANPPTDNGESVLPNFDDLVNDTPKLDSTVKADSGKTINAGQPQVTTPQAVAPQATIPQASTSQVVTSQTDVATQTTSQSVPPTMPLSENASAPVQTSTPSTIPDKKVGFVDMDGNAWIAPPDMIFPEGMRDGEMFIFSKDIDALKKRLQEAKLQETRSSQQPLSQTNVVNYQGAPGQMSSSQVTPWPTSKSWQYSPSNAQETAAFLNHPWQSSVHQGTSRLDASRWRAPQQN